MFCFEMNAHYNTHRCDSYEYSNYFIVAFVKEDSKLRGGSTPLKIYRDREICGCTYGPKNMQAMSYSSWR